MTHSKEQIEAIQARAKRAVGWLEHEVDGEPGTVAALCQQALRAIELEPQVKRLEEERREQQDRFVRQVIEVEKDISAFLGLGWRPDGMSLVTLIATLKSEIDRLRKDIKEIQQATIDGKVCDDVAWFSDIETLHDFCDSLLDRNAANQMSLPITPYTEEGTR